MGTRSHLTPLALHRLSRAQIEVMVQRLRGGKTIPVEVMQHLVEKTDGVPLYIEEMTRAILEAGVLRETADQYELVGPLTSLAIPATLQDSLMARLDRLGPAKGIAQLGATIGRQFSYALLQAVSSLDEPVVWRSLVELVEAELLYQRGSLPDATFTFKHALIQETAYQSLLKSTRQQYHERIAQTLAERFPETATTHPELLAHHYTEAGLSEPAIVYWQQAGQRARRAFSHAQKRSRISLRGLDMLRALPHTPERTAQEFDTPTGPGYCRSQATEGYAAPALERALLRAQELAQTAWRPAATLRTCYRALVAILQDAIRVTDRPVCWPSKLLSLARHVHDPAWLSSDAHFDLGEISVLSRRARGRASTHFEQAMAFYDPAQQYPECHYCGRLRVQFPSL